MPACSDITVNNHRIKTQFILRLSEVLIMTQYKICYKSISTFSSCLSPFFGRKHSKKFQKEIMKKYYLSDAGKMVDTRKFEGYDWGLFPFIP